MIRRSLPLLLLALLQACTSLPPLSPVEEDRRAKTFAPADGKAAIYVYRLDGWVGSATKFPVAIDGKLLGTLANGTYYLTEVIPGSHDVSIGWGGGMPPSPPGSLNARVVVTTLETVADEIYFVRAGHGDQNHQRVDPITGRRELLACCHLVPPQKIKENELFE
jgi:hypothetical protein